MKLFNRLSLVLFFMISSAAYASEHTEKMCAKIKECALSEAAGNEIPEQMKAIVVQMIDSQCATMASRYDASFEQAGLQDKANACVDSIVEQSCEDLMSNKESPDTEACRSFENAARDAGISVN